MSSIDSPVHFTNRIAEIREFLKIAGFVDTLNIFNKESANIVPQLSALTDASSSECTINDACSASERKPGSVSLAPVGLQSEDVKLSASGRARRASNFQRGSHGDAYPYSESSSGSSPVAGAEDRNPDLFYCNYPGCTKSFTFRTNLRRHMASHSDVKKFSCPYCSSSFRRTDDLRSHLRKHERDGTNLTMPTIVSDKSGSRKDFGIRSTSKNNHEIPMNSIHTEGNNSSCLVDSCILEPSFRTVEGIDRFPPIIPSNVQIDAGGGIFPPFYPPLGNEASQNSTSGNPNSVDFDPFNVVLEPSPDAIGITGKKKSRFSQNRRNSVVSVRASMCPPPPPVGRNASSLPGFQEIVFPAPSPSPAVTDYTPNLNLQYSGPYGPQVYHPQLTGAAITPSFPIILSPYAPYSLPMTSKVHEVLMSSRESQGIVPQSNQSPPAFHTFQNVTSVTPMLASPADSSLKQVIDTTGSTGGPVVASVSENLSEKSAEIPVGMSSHSLEPVVSEEVQHQHGKSCGHKPIIHGGKLSFLLSNGLLEPVTSCNLSKEFDVSCASDAEGSSDVVKGDYSSESSNHHGGRTGSFSISVSTKIKSSSSSTPVLNSGELEDSKQKQKSIAFPLPVSEMHPIHCCSGLPQSSLLSSAVRGRKRTHSISNQSQSDTHFHSQSDPATSVERSSSPNGSREGSDNPLSTEERKECTHPQGHHFHLVSSTPSRLHLSTSSTTSPVLGQASLAMETSGFPGSDLVLCTLSGCQSPIDIYEHEHNPTCGHPLIRHEDHEDYLVDGFLFHHHQSGDDDFGHYDIHGQLTALDAETLDVEFLPSR